MNNVLDMDSVSYKYRPSWNYPKGNVILENISFGLKPGSITGLMGKNGAGKTTLLKCALGLLKVKSGHCCNFGESSWNSSPAVRHRIGFVPQVFSGYQWMTVSDTFKYWSAFYENWDDALVTRLTEQLELTKDQQINKLSEGQKQKVSIILAVAYRPDLLILDEPVASLDPIARRNFIEILLDLYMEEDKTVLFSTHITSDLERIASDIILLKNKEISLCDSLDNLKQNVVRIRISASSNIDALIDSISNKLFVEKDADSAVITVSQLSTVTKKTLPAHRIELLNLEEIFLELMR